MDPGIVILVVFTVLAIYWLVRKKSPPATFTTETRINSDQYRKYQALMKESTALKRAGKLDEAVQKILGAYREAQENGLFIPAADYLKLPYYLQKANRNDEAWDWFNKLIRSCSDDPMTLSEIYSKMALFREREKKPEDTIKYYVLSDMYRCLGLHQLIALGDTDRESELTFGKERLEEGYGASLKKCGCAHLDDDLKKIIREHMQTFPKLRVPDVVRDINALMTKK